MAVLLATIGVAYLWKKRNLFPLIKTGIVCAIIFLFFYMERPIWYIIDSIDLAGGSTGWHRAHLINQGLKYMDEWWLAGTDHTRHWMPTGVSWNADHSDITNYYLHLGVIGGLPLLIPIIVMIWRSFKLLLSRISSVIGSNREFEFPLWCIGCTLFAHALSFVSISYFDQMFVLFYILVGGIAGVANQFPAATTAETQTEASKRSAIA